MSKKQKNVKQADSKSPFNEMDEFVTEEVNLSVSVEARPPLFQKTLAQRLQLPFIGLMLLCGLFFKS
jgi:hypothetical protein|tara:strand:+ start:195 stop:395 length:201 start_codon:yes stop_codon:yes gene_type:complete